MHHSPEEDYEHLLRRLTADGKLAYSIAETTRALGVCRATVWNLAKRNQLQVKRVAGRTLVPATEIARLLTQ